MAFEKQQEIKWSPITYYALSSLLPLHPGANFEAAPQGAPLVANFAADGTVILDDEVDESNVVMEQLGNGNYKLHRRTPQVRLPNNPGKTIINYY
ncbi:hypothetical protein Patl1_12341 [Pistacia atlantica]|uniref:Uncharacterized protein n=1 Tax=Pistacia atlantica TaxID=434234 RepID=A0ACC1A9Z3_9ROSI|nr:hypothetical protein Patl1_12341 [Pistacia atlantica]